MGSLHHFRQSAGRRGARPVPSRRPSSWGLVTELVDAGGPDAPPSHRRKGILRVGELATVCIVEDIPSVGDMISADSRADSACIVEKVRFTREGRVVIDARPFDDAA